MEETQSNVSPSLIQTKLFLPPPRPRAILRIRLMDQLQTNLLQTDIFAHRLTVIAAPAGYGKTTLACQWLHSVNLPVAWLSLDENDNDLTRFLRYVVASLQRCNPALGRSTLAMLQAPKPPPTDSLLTPLLNDLVGHPSPLIMALDDYHTIQRRSIHSAINFLVDHLPSHVHFLLASREDPPLALHRLQARGQALILRQNDLRFTPDEVVAFLKQEFALQLEASQTSALTRRTEGWITGLQLAAISLQNALDRSTFIRNFTGSNRYILDYLFEEVFNQQEGELQDFLLQISILERFCGPLCDALTGGYGSQGRIEALDRGNFFIIPLDQTRRWYRFHRLFRDLLRHRLRLGTEHDIVSLHQQASRWHAAHGSPSEAIEHALAAEDWDSATNLILATKDSMLRRGEIPTLLRWMKRIPQEQVMPNLDLSLTCCWALVLVGDIQEAGQMITHLKPHEHLPKKALGEIAAIEAFIARTLGDMPQTIKHSKKALTLLPEDDQSGRANIALNLGIITWHLGDLEEAEPALRTALTDSLATNNHYAALTAQIFLGRTLAARGDLHSAAGQYQESLRSGDTAPTAVIGLIDMAALHLEWNELKQSERKLQRAMQIVENSMNTEFQIACLIQKSLHHLFLRQLDLAAQTLEQAYSLLPDDDLPPLTRARRCACRIQISIAGGDIASARELLQSMPVPHDAHTFHRFLSLNEARLNLALGKRNLAQELLERSYAQAMQAHWGHGALATRVLQAIASDSQVQALDYLDEALKRAEPQGYLRMFLNEGDDLIPILQTARRDGIAPEYINRILDAHSRHAPHKFLPGIAEPLTSREVEVLRLAASGLSNRQIANRLVISLGTVKSHLNHIFGKLYAENRTQAAARARELDLI